MSSKIIDSMLKISIVISIIILFISFSACVPATPNYDFPSLLGTATKIALIKATHTVESGILTEKFNTPTPGVDVEFTLTPTLPAITSTPTAEHNSTKPASYSPESEGFNRPEGILEIINFSQSQNTKQNPGCSSEMTSPSVDPTSLTHFELTGYIFLTFCGWLEGEKVRVTINYSDGRFFTQEYIAETMLAQTQAPYVAFAKELEVSDPTGIYLITAKGDQSGSVIHNVNVIQPMKPQLRQENGSQVFFSFFKPGEIVRLYLFQSDDSRNYRFKSWQDFTMDQKGQLLVDTFEMCEVHCYFAALGEQSGEAFDALSSQIYMSIHTSSPPELQCSGAPLQRLRIGGRGYVCTDQVNRPLYRQPKYSAPILLDLSSNTFFEIFRGPVCEEGTSFWRVRLESGRTGWISEGEARMSSYFLCPAP